MALMMSLSDFAEVEHTETHAEVSFGALIVTVFFTVFAVFFVVILGFTFSIRLAERVVRYGLSVGQKEDFA